jgi:hypothetical protein
MVYNTQRYWVFGLCPPSGFFLNKWKTQRFGNWICFLTDNFPIQNGLKQEDALLSFLFTHSLVYAIWKAQEHRVRLKWNGTHHLLIYADDATLLENNIYTRTIKKNIVTLFDTSKEVGLSGNTEKT